MKVGITGSNGFIGYHLWIHLKYLCEDLEVIRLSRDLKEISKCDVVVHLAEKNRGDEDEIYHNNTSSASTLASTMNGNQRILYASSIHEDDDSVFGRYRK